MCFVTCSNCGKQVSNEVESYLDEGMVLRAWVECPECAGKETQMNKKLDEKSDADEDVANLNYLNGKRDGIKEILDKIGKDYTNQDGWIIIPMLNWREIRKQYRKILLGQ